MQQRLAANISPAPPVPMPLAHATFTEFSVKRDQRNLFAWGLLSAIVLLGCMAGPFYLNRVYTRDDLGSFHLPLRAHYATQLARGETFDWMPQLFGGFYLTGEGQIGAYHPLHLLLYRVLRLEAALALEYLLSYPLLLAGMYWFLRRRRLRRGAAMFGALAFTFGSFNMLHFVHPNAIAVVAHTPCLLALVDLVWRSETASRRAAATAGIAVATGSQILLGYPQYVWFSLLAETSFALWLTLRREGHPTPAWLAWCCGKGLGLLLGAVQLAPTVEALGQSARHVVDAQFTNVGALHPLNLVQLIGPYLFADRVLGGNTHESGLYIGAVPLMLLVWLRCRQRPLGRWRPLVLASVVFAGLCLALAFGQAAGLYRLQQLLPLVGGFRCPCRYLVLCQLATALVAAVAFALLTRQIDRRQPSSPAELRPLWIAAGLSGAAASVGLGMQGHPLVAAPGRVLLGPLLVVLAAGLVTLAARGRRWALPALVAFTAVDLGCYGLSYAVYPGAWPLPNYLQCVALPPEGPAPGERLAGDLNPPNSSAPCQGNQCLLAGWRRIDGYAGLTPQRRLDYRSPAALRLAGVRWVLPSEAARNTRGLTEHSSGWLQAPPPLPRVRLMSHVQASADPRCDVERVCLDTTALVDQPLRLPASQPGRAEILIDRPGRIEVLVDAPAPQLLTVAESYHAGWQAIANGRPAPTLRVNGDFLGCRVEAGHQQVAFEFRPASLRLGKWLSLVGLGLTGSVWIGGQFVRRSTSTPHSAENAS